MSDRAIHDGDIREYRSRLPVVQPIDFSADTNPLGMPCGVREAFFNSLDGCMSYPDALYSDLKAAIGEFDEADAEKIACAGGSRDIIFRIARTLGAKKVLIPAPISIEYGCGVTMAGSEIIYHDLPPAKDFDMDESILPLIADADIFYLSNPNSLTGRFADDDLMVKIASACEDNGTLLIADERFSDFADDYSRRSFKRFLALMEGIIVIKTFSKTFAMPGLRLGYALTGSEKLASMIEAAGPPLSVSSPAVNCALAAVDELEYLFKTRVFIGEQRELMQNGLEGLGFHVCQGSANFILFYSQAQGLAARLMENGFIIRDCSGLRGLSAGWLMAAIRSEGENAALLNAVKELV